jgi:hypothetical protein
VAEDASGCAIGYWFGPGRTPIEAAPLMRFDGNGRFSILCGNGIAEAILTVASGGSDSAFLKLRHYLNEQGLTITARTIEDIPHPECLVQPQATYEQLVRNYSADLSAASEHDTGSPVNIMTTHRGPEIGPSDTNDQ